MNKLFQFPSKLFLCQANPWNQLFKNIFKGKFSGKWGFKILNFIFFGVLSINFLVDFCKIKVITSNLFYIVIAYWEKSFLSYMIEWNIFSLQIEYDLSFVGKTNNKVWPLASDRIEQGAIPQCMTRYPPITKEHFFLTATDQVSV